MVVQLPQHWDVAIDGIQIILCILIVGLLIRNRRQNRETARHNSNGYGGANFNAQFLTQTLRQQVDEAFANIARTIALEQSKLEKSLPVGGVHGRTHDLGQYAAEIQLSDEQPLASPPGERLDRDPLLDKIRRLAAKGKTSEQISEAVKVPLGEVELVLSLQPESDA
jgi:hypothetical protein